MKDSQTPTESLVKQRNRGTVEFLSITNTVADLLPDSQPPLHSSLWNMQTGALGQPIFTTYHFSPSRPSELYTQRWLFCSHTYYQLFLLLCKLLISWWNQSAKKARIIATKKNKHSVSLKCNKDESLKILGFPRWC